MNCNRTRYCHRRCRGPRIEHVCLILTLGVAAASVYVPVLHHSYVYSSCVSAVVWCILSAWGRGVASSRHRRPSYYDDLQIVTVDDNDDDDDDKQPEDTDDTGNTGGHWRPDLRAVPLSVKYKYQHRFTRIMNIVTAITVGVVTQHGLYQAQHQEPRSMGEFAAFVGGLLALVSRILSIVGKLLLKYLLWRRQKDIQVIQILV